MPIDHGEVVRDQRAKIRHRAARVNEGDEQRLAAELIEMNRAPVLIAQLEIGNRVARRGHVIEHRRLVIGLALRNHHNVIEHNVRIGILRDQHIGGDGVAGMQLAENARILQLVGHGHRIHEAGNGLMIHRHFAGRRIGRNHLPAQLVHLEAGAAELCASGFGLEWHPAKTATASSVLTTRIRIVSSVQPVD